MASRLDHPTGISTTPQRPGRLLRRRSIWIAAACWAVANLFLMSLHHLPLQASALAEPPAPAKVLSTDAMFVEVFMLMVVVHLLTRRRTVPDIADRAPQTPLARQETILVLGYGLLALAGGFWIGRLFGWHAFGFHLDGMVIRTGQPVSSTEALGWAGYNLIAYAVVPFLVFRRRYTTEQLSLRSSDRRRDLLLVVVVLVIESAVQLSVTTNSVLDVSGRQLLLGAPVTFVVSLAGTVLPTMVFVCCILVPRYVRLTRSVPAAVLLGGVTYALLHFFDGWTNFASPTDALVSVTYLLLFYTAPGMFKSFITIRTANAWVHVWAYHAIAPHTLVDTPMFVRIFGIR